MKLQGGPGTFPLVEFKDVHDQDQIESTAVDAALASLKQARSKKGRLGANLSVWRYVGGRSGELLFTGRVTESISDVSCA